MTNKVKRVLLIDDDSNVNFLNKTIIRHSNFAEEVSEFQKASEALLELKDAVQNDNLPEIIFLDINMPEMDGWKFLDEYQKLHIDGPVIIMLTSSIDPKDQLRAKQIPELKGFRSKPLSMASIEELRNVFFSN